MELIVGLILVIVGILGAAFTVFAATAGNDLIISTVMMLTSFAVLGFGARICLRPE